MNENVPNVCMACGMRVCVCVTAITTPEEKKMRDPLIGRWTTGHSGNCGRFECFSRQFIDSGYELCVCVDDVANARLCARTKKHSIAHT